MSDYQALGESDGDIDLIARVSRGKTFSTKKRMMKSIAARVVSATALGSASG
jgi:hypothetical protein